MKINKSFLLVLILIIAMLSSGLTYVIVNAKNISDSTNLTSLDSLAGKMIENQNITEQRNNAITKTIKNINSTIVGITVTELRQYRDPFFSFWGDDPWFKQFFGDRSYNREVKNLGSGAIISPDGYVITNDHVAGNAVKIVVTMTNGEHYEAEVVGTDLSSDVCLLKLKTDRNDLSYLKFGNSDDIMIGEWVIALGNPFGLFELNDQPTVTVGVISAKGMNLGAVNNRYYVNMLQTDAAINGGNSGGPLVNIFGEIIGMNTLIYTAGGSSGNIGLGFAIPANKVLKIVEELKEDGTVNRDFWTGLRIQSIDEGISKYYNLNSTRGVIVTQIIPNSPADNAGLKVGDIITEIDNFKINNDQALIGILQEFRTNDLITLKVLRIDRNRPIEENDFINIKMKLERKND